MITVLAIIMSVMILVLAILLAGVALLAHDVVKERDSLRAERDHLTRWEALLNDFRDEIATGAMEHYNDIVNRHL